MNTPVFNVPSVAPLARCEVARFANFRRHVAELDRAVDFYCGALGFSCASIMTIPSPTPAAATGGNEPSRVANLSLGEQSVTLIASANAQSAALAISDSVAVADVAFQHIAIVTCDMAAACASLQRFGPREISRDGAVTLPASAGGVSAYKFRDPDGHPLELIHFPEGSGDARWHCAPRQQPTLGIDHSAISVADVERSIGFYVEALGFSVASRQVNHGAQQSRLDGVAESIVDVVALMPSRNPTPHVELLGYRMPRRNTAARQTAVEGADTMVFIAAGMIDDAAGSRSNLTRAIDPDGHRFILQIHEA